MVVCVCNAIRERQVRDAARAGCRDARSAYAALGHRPRCGQCIDFARTLIDEEASAAA